MEYLPFLKETGAAFAAPVMLHVLLSDVFVHGDLLAVSAETLEADDAVCQFRAV